MGPLLLQLGLAPSAGGSQLSPILCPHLCARPCPSPRPLGCIDPKRNCSHSLFATRYQDCVLNAEPWPPRPARAPRVDSCRSRGWPGRERQPPPYTIGQQCPAAPLLSAHSLHGGPKPLGTCCPPSLALPELVACPGPWKRSSMWPLSHTQDRVRTWRRPASAQAFLPGDGQQPLPHGQAFSCPVWPQGVTGQSGASPHLLPSTHSGPHIT